MFLGLEIRSVSRGGTTSTYRTVMHIGHKGPTARRRRGVCECAHKPSTTACGTHDNTGWREEEEGGGKGVYCLSPLLAPLPPPLTGGASAEAAAANAAEKPFPNSASFALRPARTSLNSSRMAFPVPPLALGCFAAAVSLSFALGTREGERACSGECTDARAQVRVCV